ncbi:hypothetical protein B0H14DRAFT_3531415 [Mycena olivaceomarginata]|nr:hypothetical protein B0H14DRAFT_3531415 [Mycena olivaceomarginata]
MPPMNLTNTVADPEGLILAQMDRERDPVESENPNEQISEAVAPPSSKKFRQDVRRRIEELKRMIEERALELAQRSQRPLDEIRHLLTVRDGDEDADINIRLLLGLNQSHATPPVPSTAFFHVPLPATSLLHGDKTAPKGDIQLLLAPSPSTAAPPARPASYSNGPSPAAPVLDNDQTLPGPLGAFSTPTPTPQINRTPRPPRNVLSANPPKNHTKLRSEVVQSLIWGLKHGSGNEKAVMHYGELYERMTEARYGWRLMGWPDGVLLEPPAQMLAGGSGAAQMLWKRLDSGTCYWEKLPDAEYHALREKYQGFKRVKVEKGEVQEHHDGPRSSTLGKRRRYLPRNEVDHSTSHESTVPKGRGGTARQPAKRCRASPEAPPSRKLNSALSDQPQAISVTRVSTRNSPGGIKIKIPRRSPKRLSQIHGASSDCDSDESG